MYIKFTLISLFIYHLLLKYFKAVIPLYVNKCKHEIFSFINNLYYTVILNRNIQGGP